MSDLPDGWEWSEIGEVSHKPQYGWTTKSEQDDEGLHYLRTTDITKGPVDWSTVPRCVSEPEDPDKYLLEAGDIVVSRAGSVGVSALLGESPPALFASYLIRLRVLAPLSERFLYWFLQSPAYWDAISQAKAGIAVQNVNAKKLAGIQLPVPPIPEQRRIVAAIEEHFSRLDAAEGLLRNALRRVPLLVSSQRESELAEELEVFPVGDLADDHRNALAIGPFGSNLKVSDYRDQGVPLVFVRDIRRRQFGGGGTRFIDEDKAAELASHTVREGDVLVTKMGDPPGDVALYRGPDAVITADCVKISPAPTIRADFLAEALQTTSARRQIEAITKGVAQRKVSLGRFRKEVRLPSPHLPRQREIVERIAAVEQDAVRLASEIEAAQTRADALRRSILAAGFSGQLVPQVPSDEPASALLERMAAERAASKLFRKTKAGT